MTTSPAGSPVATPDLDRLLRWTDAGGTWEVVHRAENHVTVALCRCDGGEEADRFRSAEPALLAFLAEHGA
ncbi:hypothetical protein BKD30_06595 [Tersicoccus phoenicis]|uniref:Uncharacterized protein n=1 Tax=Tersicoccus phoenicis TaxID=554083 RepID=A0A1R1LC85_9MICC|nr:hypothetical protein [Tersicoccus phoenicis]OMH25130.1 hypothetical protein BKD30_06595 [Tersicoccus phoenicis]